MVLFLASISLDSLAFSIHKLKKNVLRSKSSNPRLVGEKTPESRSNK
jgi:hypothetical protein